MPLLPRIDLSFSSGLLNPLLLSSPPLPSLPPGKRGCQSPELRTEEERRCVKITSRPTVSTSTSSRGGERRRTISTHLRFPPPFSLMGTFRFFPYGGGGEFLASFIFPCFRTKIGGFVCGGGPSVLFARCEAIKNIFTLSRGRSREGGRHPVARTEEDPSPQTKYIEQWPKKEERSGSAADMTNKKVCSEETIQTKNSYI